MFLYLFLFLLFLLVVFSIQSVTVLMLTLQSSSFWPDDEMEKMEECEEGFFKHFEAVLGGFKELKVNIVNT